MRLLFVSELTAYDFLTLIVSEDREGGTDSGEVSSESLSMLRASSGLSAAGSSSEDPPFGSCRSPSRFFEDLYQISIFLDNYLPG